MQNSRKITAEVIASIALIMLVVYIADAGVSMINKASGFLPLSAKDRGMIFGGGSILLFLIAYGVGSNIISKPLTVILIIGGAIMGTAVLASTFMMPGNSSMTLSSSSTTKQMQTSSGQFIAVIAIGYIIMGLGILRAIRKK